MHRRTRQTTAQNTMTDMSQTLPPSPEQIAAHLAFSAVDWVDSQVFRNNPVGVSLLRASGLQGRDLVQLAEWWLALAERAIFIAPAEIAQRAQWASDREASWRRLRESIEAVRDDIALAARGGVA